MPEAQDTVVTQALASVIRDHGWRVAADPARLRASVSDVLGQDADEHRGLVDALVISAEQGTPHALRDAGLDGVPARRAALISDLESWGLSGERAAWVVDAWTGLLPGRTDAPPATSAPPPVAEEPTVVPGGPMIFAVDQAPTELPAPRVESPPPPPEKAQPRRARRVWLIGAAAVALVAAGTAVALSAHDGDDSPTRQPSKISSSGSTGGRPLAAGHVMLAPSTRPTRASGRLVMADRAGGVRLSAFGPVDSVGTGSSMVMPPDGGSLVAFSVADWCPTSQCAHWQSLGLRVAVGGALTKVPTKGRTFVVAVPHQDSKVALVLSSPGHDQRLSLTDGRPSSDNITALTRKLGVHRVTGSADTVASTTLSFIQFGEPRKQVTRHAVVTAAGLGYFAGALTPKDPGDALVYVHAYYDGRVYGDSQHFPFLKDEVHFQPAGGKEVAPLGIPKPGGDGTLVYVFEVPASIKTGSFVVGGQGLPRTVTARSASDTVEVGRSYTLSLTPARIPLRFS